ncbi:MAG: transcriptional regulator, partial [Chloroflexota bacterium]
MSVEVSREKEILDRLKRIEGQVRGIQRMIEERRGCEPVLTQILSAKTALERVAAEIVATSIEECLRERPPQQAQPEISRL